MSESSLAPSPTIPSTRRTRARPGTGMLYQQKRRDGTLAPIFWSKVYSHGRPIRESTGTDDRAAAERILRERLDRADKGLPIVRLHTVLFTELLDDLQAHYDSSHRRNPVEAKRRLAPLREYFKGWKAAEVDAAAWDRYVADRRRRGAVSNATLNRALCFVIRALRLALERGKVARVPVIHSLKESAPRQGFLEREDFEAIVKHLDPVVALGCRIAYTLAWRRSEVFKLERRQVYLETGALTLEKTKNGDTRRAYLTAELVAALREHLAKVDALQIRLGRVFRRVFVYTEGASVGRQVGAFRVAWPRACKAAGRPGAIFHDLRRSGIRNMVRNGVSETIAMKISGHRTAPTFRRYNITSDEDLRAVAARMGGSLGMSSGIPEPGAAKTRLVSMRSS